MQVVVYLLCSAQRLPGWFLERVAGLGLMEPNSRGVWLPPVAKSRLCGEIEK